jgi:hypothetical protein
MPDLSSPDRYKPDMPEIPGLAPQAARGRNKNPALRLVGGLIVVLILVFVGARMTLRPKHLPAPTPQPTPQIEVPSPAPDPNALIPHSTDEDPGIATLSEMAKPWTSKDFFFRNRLTGENVPALLVRLPAPGASQPNGYWAFALNSPYGNCQLEYVSDLDKLKNDYGYHAAKHPMVGNPCSHTLFDPLHMANLPGDVWVRGSIAQGSDLRPPLGIQLKIEGKRILAVRME